MALMLTKDQLKQITQLSPSQRTELEETTKDVAAHLMLEEIQEFIVENNGEITPENMALITDTTNFEQVVVRYSNFLRKKGMMMMTEQRRRQIAAMNLDQKLTLPSEEKDLAVEFMLEEMREFVGSDQQKVLDIAAATGKNRALEAMNLINGIAPQFLATVEFYAGYLKVKDALKEKANEEPLQDADELNEMITTIKSLLSSGKITVFEISAESAPLSPSQIYEILNMDNPNVEDIKNIYNAAMSINASKDPVEVAKSQI